LALPLLEQSFKKMKMKRGPNHSETLASAVFLAMAYKAAGQLDDAEPLFAEATAGYRATLGYADPTTQVCLNALLDCYSDLKQPKKAEPIWRESVAFSKEKSGADSSEYAAQLAMLCLNLLEQKKFTDAEPLIRECLSIREKKHPDDWRTFNTKSLLGGSLLGQKKYAEAEPLLLVGYEGMKQHEADIPAQGKIRLTEAIQRLVDLYDATDQKDKADEWRKKLPEPPKPVAWQCSPGCNSIPNWSATERGKTTLSAPVSTKAEYVALPRLPMTVTGISGRISKNGVPCSASSEMIER
jgi:tetratricopeptide (TPR) repeat protein